MPQQINLLDASFQRRTERLGSVAGLFAVGAVLVTTIVATLGLKALDKRISAEAEGKEREVAALQTRVASVRGGAASPLVSELARLRVAEERQQRIRAALDAGQAGVVQGYSEHLFALSRQAQEGLCSRVSTLRPTAVHWNWEAA